MPDLLATNNGVSVSALDEGVGPALLVVHPGGGTASAWDAVARSLANDFRVVRIHRRIYVPGAPIPPDHSMASEAADILAIAALLPPPIILVGHSSGAVAALEAARTAPTTFAGMVLYEPPLPTRSLVGGEASQRARAALDAGHPIDAIRIHLRDIVQLPAQIVDAMCNNRMAHPILAATAPAQLADTDALDALGIGTTRYRTLALPTVLIEGDLSPPHLRARLADLAAALPTTRTITLPNQGHIAHYTSPGLLASTIRDAAHDLLLHLRSTP